MSTVVIGFVAPTEDEFDELPVFATPNDAFAAGIRDPNGFRLEGWSFEQHCAQVERMNVPATQRERLAALRRGRTERERLDDERAAALDARRRAAQPGSVERDGDVVTIVDEACGIRFTLAVDCSDAHKARDLAQVAEFKVFVLKRLAVLAGAASTAANEGHWNAYWGIEVS